MARALPVPTLDDAPLAPGLYVVATPIGNLRDITLRALDVLAQADLVLAEDTRVTARLLTAYGLKARLERCDDHASARAAELALEGAALASDAFFPFSDGPGLAVEAGVTTIIQPGGSRRDHEVVEAADAAGISMVFTHRRHFKH